MKSYQIYGILLLIGILLMAFMVNAWLDTKKSPRIQAAEEEQRINDIFYYGWLKQWCAVIVPASLLLALLIGVSCLGLAHVKRASVHIYKIGKHNEVVVHEKDLSIAAPIAMGLMNAEQLKQMNGGLERAFDLYAKMAEVQSKQIQSLVRGHLPQISPAAGEPETISTQTPTFHELLNSGDIAPGKPMILGYQNGTARRGSFLDIYSAAVAGESGSGKTATLLFLIGSAMVSMPVRFLGIDPHYPHPKSLGFKTKPLWEAGLMRMATYKDDMLRMLSEVEQTIERRLKQVETDTTPVVLVIDELAFLSTTSIGPAIAKTMERISMEGRKCAVYMLASSQTWLTSKTGGSSSVRDTLTSAYVHRIKPKQANLLLQDKDEAAKVRKQVKHAGEALLVPVGDESAVVKIPYASDADMKLVANMVDPIFVHHQVNDLTVNQPVNQPINLRTLTDGELVNQVNMRLKKGDLTELAEIVGVSKPMLSVVLNSKKGVSKKVRAGFLNYLIYKAIEA
jgi:hypothetical protein